MCRQFQIATVPKARRMNCYFFFLAVHGGNYAFTKNIQTKYLRSKYSVDFQHSYTRLFPTDRLSFLQERFTVDRHM